MADDAVERGLHAWTAGDVDALAAVLAPDVTLLSVEPGDWDCIGRDQVVRLLRDRSGSGPVLPMKLDRVDDTHVVVSPAEPSTDGTEMLPATRITITAGRVTTMQQYRSRAEAIRGEHRVPEPPADH